jgi:uncharacterized protein YegL
MLLTRIGLILLLLASFPMSTFAQKGVSSMSVGVARAGIGSRGPNGHYLMPTPDMIRIEEFINYHRHTLPLPVDGKRVRLDAKQVSYDGKAVLQIGIATPQSLPSDEMAPLNLVLVIDRSGSMAGDRISNVKKAVRNLIEQFRESDKISIVGFSSDARVHLAPCKKTNISEIDVALSEIQAGGGTNLYAGLMLGYKQALKHFDPERTNRVIFLTDGNANIGTTDAEEIAAESKKCNKRGISLSTIGLGEDFNHQLLRELADKGHGLVHFVSDSQDIQKTFVKEVESLLAPAANKVRLTIDLGVDSSDARIFGYQPKKRDDGTYQFRLDDLNYGATQVVMIELPQSHANRYVSATLEYIDALSGEKNILTVESHRVIESKKHRMSVLLNYSIATLAASMHKAAKLSQDGKLARAQRQLEKAVERSKKILVDKNDKDAARIIKLAEGYLANIVHCNELTER